ncbi:hypothetical protein TWF281_010516 [Arthrobotrys megalospora]
MPCAGPYLPDEIYLSNANERAETKYFLRHGWPRWVASRLARNPFNYGNWLRAYEIRPFVCREQEFLSQSDQLDIEAQIRRFTAMAETVTHLAGVATELITNGENEDSTRFAELSNALEDLATSSKSAPGEPA